MGDMENKVIYPGWETVRKIGTGSFGTVYEIERDLFGKKEKAALKLISIPQNESDIDELYGNGFDDASITAHFQNYLADIVREYSLMAEMKGHTNVVYCDDIRYVQHDDGFGWDIYIKMELLTPMMKALGKEVTDEQVIKLGRDICNALVLCKSRNIIHRDIKPQNVFISNDGDYKLGDFGIAKTVEKTSGGTKIGTYNYMAPEVYNNEPYGHAADIYSLGLVMYWLLNERRMPFNPLPPAVPTASEMDEARLRRFQGEPVPAPVHGSEELKQIVLKACAYDPKDRYQSAEEMLAALEGMGKPAGQEPVIPAQQAEEDDDPTEGFGWKEKEPEPEEDKTVGAWAKPKNEPEPEEDKTVGAWTKPEKEPEEEKMTGVWAAPEQSKPAPTPTPEKKSGKKKIIGIIAACLALTLVLGFAASHAAQTANQAAEGKGSVARESTAPVNNEKSVAEESNAAAAKETNETIVKDPKDYTGNLVIYSAQNEDTLNTCVEMFCRKYPNIHVEAIMAGAGELCMRVAAETGNPQGDVLWDIGADTLEAYTDCLAAYVCANDEAIEEAYKDEDNLWIGTSPEPMVFIYNKTLIDENDVPSTWDGLCEQSLRGRIAFASPAKSNSAYIQLCTMLFSQSSLDKGWSLVERFIANLGGIIQDSAGNCHKLVASGEYVLGVTTESSAVLYSGNPNIGYVYPEKDSAVPSTVALIKNCPNEENAKLFIDFVTGIEWQSTQMDYWSLRPARNDISPVGRCELSELDLCNFDFVYAADKETILKQWSSLTGG